MHSKCHYKIFYLSGHPMGTWAFSKLQGLRQFYFPENFRCDLAYYEGGIFFLIPLSITFFNPKIFGFLFCTKNSLTWGVKCETKKKKKKSLRKL